MTSSEAIAPNSTPPHMPGRPAWPRISVVLPNYNHCHFLKISLPALLAQTYPPHEIIVVDDGSHDESVAYIRAMQERYPAIHLIRHEKNQGVVAALNTGIHEITGDVVYLAGADDEAYPGLFEEAARMLAAHPEAGLFCSDGEIYYALEQHAEIHRLGLASQPTYFPPRDFLNRVGQLPYFYFESHTILTPRKAFEELGGLDPQLGYRSDWFVNWVNVARHGCCYSPQVLARFLDRGNNFSLVTAKNVTADREIWRKIIAKLHQPAFQDVWPFILDAARHGGDPGMIERIFGVLLEKREHWKMVSWAIVQAACYSRGQRIFGYLRRNLAPARILDDLFHLFRWLLWRAGWAVGYGLGQILPSRANALRLFAMRLTGAEVPDDCWVASSARIRRPWKLQLGRQVRIGARVKIDSRVRMQIGSRTVIEDDVIFPLSPPAAIPILSRAPIVIGEDCQIGARARIFAGSKVPSGTRVPCNAVITPENPGV